MASTKLILNGNNNYHQLHKGGDVNLNSSPTANSATNKAYSLQKSNGTTQNNGNNKPTNGTTTTTSAIATTSTNNDSNSKSYQALLEVRKKFIEYAEKNPDKVNERDKIKLATDDWYLKRYLLARNRNVNQTLQMLRKTMEWRNEFGIHISEDAMFPLEFYKIGALFPFENDRKNNLVLYLRIKYHRKIDEMVEVEKHFLVHTFEKIDRITNGQGLVIVFDCEGAGYANCDVDFLQFLIMCATEHAPVGLQYIIVYKLPWVLNAFWTLAKKLLPAYLANRVRFCDENSIKEYIDPANLPDYMYGTSKRNYRWVPPGCPSVFKLARAHGITDAEIDRILPQFQAFLDEADEALSSNSYEDPPDTITKYVNNPVTAPNLLSDLALCKIGLGSSSQESMRDTTTICELGERTNANRASLTSATSVSASIIRLFPEEFIEFNYDSYNDVFHATVTIFNPNERNSLAFKLMSNRPSNYSVKPARGVLSPNAMLTLSIVLLNEHKSSDKFLIVAQPLENEVKSISKAQFDSLWSERMTGGQSTTTTHTTIKLGSCLRKIVASSAIQSTVKNPQVYELVSSCRSLKRKQDISFVLNVLFLIIIVHMYFFN